MTGIYMGQTGWLDGLQFGKEYELFECNDHQYLIRENEVGGESQILKSKFEVVNE
jgi:hypothetical protein